MKNPEIIKISDLAARNDAYFEDIEKHLSEGEHLWITVRVDRINYADSSCYEQDVASIVAFIGPHCAVCGTMSDSQEVGERCSPL